MNILDLRGPEFLQFYLITLAIVTAACVFIRLVFRGGAARPPGRQIALEPLELAYLSGGPAMAVDAAMVALIHRGTLKLDVGTARLSPTGALHPNQTESLLSRYIVARVQGGDRRITSVRNAAISVAQTLAPRLVALGLVPESGRIVLTRGLPPMLMLAVLILGIMKVVVGISRNRPVEILIILCLVPIVLAVLFAARPVRRTAEGGRVLREYRSRSAALRTAAASAPMNLGDMDISLACALFGTAFMSRGALGDVHRALHPTTNGGGFGGDGGGGGSCGGGGGCGGGGCGGCGG